MGSKNNLELKTIEDVIKFMGDDDALLVRNIEDPDKFRHWVENYDSVYGEVEISEDLFMDCFDNQYFDFAKDIPSDEFEFYFRYYGPVDES